MGPKPKRRSRAVPAALALVLVALGGAWLLWGHGHDDGGRASGQVASGAAWQFRDGRMVKLSPLERAELAQRRSERTPGLVGVNGAVRASGPVRHGIGGAQVVFRGEHGEATTTADADGQYRIELAPGFYRLYARAPGYVAVVRLGEDNVPNMGRGSTVESLAPELALFRDLSGVDITMSESGVLVGSVFDERGSPVSGATVAANPYARRRATIAIAGTGAAITDADGSFRLELPAGPHKLVIDHDDYAGLADISSRHVNIVPGQVHRADLTLSAGCIIEGQVLDARGAPVGPGVLEQATGEDGNSFEPIGKLSDDGRFRFRAAIPGSYVIRARPWKSPPSSTVRLQCSPGLRQRDLRLAVIDASESLSGTIQSAARGAVSSAYIDLFPLTPGGATRRERANDRGEFSFFQVPNGRYRLTSFVRGYGVLAREITVPAANLQLQLSGTGMVAGAVRGITSGSFTLVVEQCATSAQTGLGAVATPSTPSTPSTIPTTAYLVPVEHGRYRLRGLPACAMTARAETPERSVLMQIEIDPSRAAEFDLDLRTPKHRHVEGIVRTTSGSPVAGATVIRVNRSGTSRRLTDYMLTGTDGSFTMEAYSGDRLQIGKGSRNAIIDIDWIGEGPLSVKATL